MKKLTSKLDEMLEQKTAKAEIIGLYLTAAALAIAMLIQVAMDVPVQQFLGEFIIFEALCIYMIVMGLRIGVWDRFFVPGLKNYLTGSLIAATGVSIFILIIDILYGPIYSMLKDLLIWFCGTFSGCYIVMAFLGMLCKKRRNWLDRDPDYQELAQKIGVTVQTLKAIENGTYNPSIKLCRKICEATGTTLNDLFGEESKKIRIRG